MPAPPPTRHRAEDFPCVIAQGLGVIASPHVIVRGFLRVIAQGMGGGILGSHASSHRRGVITSFARHRAEVPHTSSRKGVGSTLSPLLARHRAKRLPVHVIAQGMGVIASLRVIAQGFPCVIAQGLGDSVHPSLRVIAQRSSLHVIV